MASKKFQSFKIFYKLVLGARVSVLKVTDKNLDQSIDITVNNVAGVVNSVFLRIYSQINPLIVELGVMIKNWAKSADMIGPSKFSSYGLLLMMLHFLIERQNIPIIIN